MLPAITGAIETKPQFYVTATGIRHSKSGNGCMATHLTEMVQAKPFNRDDGEQSESTPIGETNG